MTPVPARWTKHRPIALGLAREYRVPGMDPDDVRQEALIALWEACRAYDREKPKCQRAPRKAPLLYLVHRRETLSRAQMPVSDRGNPFAFLSERTCSPRSTPPTTPRPHRQSDQQQADKECDGSDKVSVNRTARYGHGRIGTGRVPLVEDCEQSVQAHHHAADKQQTFSGAAHGSGTLELLEIRLAVRRTKQAQDATPSTSRSSPRPSPRRSSPHSSRPPTIRGPRIR